MDDEKAILMAKEEKNDHEVRQINSEDDLDDVFDRASRLNRAQRIRTFFLAIFSAVFFYNVVRPMLPEHLPVELTSAGLRPQKGNFNHHHHDNKPCPGRMAGIFTSGFFNNARVAAENSAEAFKAGLDTKFLDPRNVEKIIEKIYLAVPSAEGAKEALRGYTQTTHVAGSNADYDSAIQVLQQWGESLGADLPKNLDDLVFDAGSEQSIHYMTSTRQDQKNKQGFAPKNPLGKPRAWVDTYNVWLNYPVSSSLTLSKENETDRPYYRASLTEDILPKDPTSIDGLPTFHGYSKSGKAKGPIVYAGRCSKEDFEELEKRGVKIAGSITLCQYGGSFRGLKVRMSAERGAVGTLIYTDPKEDGQVTEANGFTAYPDGPARQPSSVQRGSVQAISIYSGDPSTPGKPSYRNASRLDPEVADSLPKIPSLPISYKDAKPFLHSLTGLGIESADLPSSFKGAVPGVTEYWTGPSVDIVELDNQMTDINETKDIWNTYALIPGVLEDEIVILSNHRDAWTFGAGDPNSGTAMLHELVKGLGVLVKRGWRPLRTILIASWDAEEYGLVGSTEAAEDYADFFKEKATIFLNCDVAVRGGQLAAKASPSLRDYIIQAASEVADPSGNGTTIKLTDVGALGSGSDYTAYLQHLGIASVDSGFDRADTDPVYHYHSNYDSFYWMSEFGDKGFARHHAAAQYVGLLALRASQSLFLPFNVTAYAETLSTYLEKVQKVSSDRFDLSKLEDAIVKVKKSARSFDAEKQDVQKRLDEIFSGHRGARLALERKRPSHQLRKLFARVRSLNRRAKLFETGFLSTDGKGLSERSFYQHLGVAPGRYLGYGATTFPGVTESITLDGGKETEKEIERLIDALKVVRKNLDHGDGHWKPPKF
ncbi:hypothetical protein L7F22_019295 [Adiantum nelumboides]|nr:hypothetical protein [Adiantum nelumboides]